MPSACAVIIGVRVSVVIGVYVGLLRPLLFFAEHKLVVAALFAQFFVTVYLFSAFSAIHKIYPFILIYKVFNKLFNLIVVARFVVDAQVRVYALIEPAYALLRPTFFVQLLHVFGGGKDVLPAVYE